jgi:hypothetical protein
MIDATTRRLLIAALVFCLLAWAFLISFVMTAASRR